MHDVQVMKKMVYERCLGPGRNPGPNSSPEGMLLIHYAIQEPENPRVLCGILTETFALPGLDGSIFSEF